MATRDEILRFLVDVTGEKDLDALANALEGVGNQSKESEAKTKGLVDRLDKLTDTARGAADFVRLKAALSETTDKLEAAQNGLEGLNEEFDRSDKSSRKVSKAFADAEKQIAALTKEQNQQSVALQKTSAELEKAGVDVNQLADEQDRLRDEALKANRALENQAQNLAYAREAAERNARALESMGRAFQGLRSQINDVGTKLLQIGSAATAAAAAFAAYKTGQFFSGAIESAAEFEAKLKEVQAVSGATADELDQMKAAAIAAGKQFGFTFVEAAEGLDVLARATGDAQTAIAGLPAVLSLARAGGLDVAAAAEIATTTLTQFGLTAEDTVRIADVLAEASNATQSSVQGLGNSLSYAAPLARQLGLDLEQTTAIIAELADQGFRGERAGTALRNVFSALSDPASKFSKALDDAGIKSRDFVTVLEALSQRADKGKSVFLALDAEARPAIISLAEAGVSSIRELDAALNNASGSAARVAAQMQSSLLGVAKRLENEFDGLRQALVEPLFEPVQAELESLTKALSEFQGSPEFAEAQQALVQIFEAGVEAVRKFVSEVDLVAVTDKIKTFATDAGENIDTFVEKVGAIVETIKLMVDTVTVLVNAFETGVTAVGGVVAKLAEIGTEMGALEARIASFLPSVSLLSDALGVDFAEAADKAENAAGAFGAVADAFFDATVENANDTKDAIKEFIGTLPEAAEKTAQAAGDIAASTEIIKDGMEGAAAASENAAERVGAASEEMGAGAEAAKAQVDALPPALAVVGDAAASLQERVVAAFNAWRIAMRDGAPPEEIARLEKAFLDLNAQLGTTQAKAAGAAEAIKGVGSSAASAASDVAAVAESAAPAAEGIRDVGAAAQSSSIELGVMSEKVNELFDALNDSVASGSGKTSYLNTLNGILSNVTQQRDLVDQRLDQINQEIALTDENTQALKRLADMYPYVEEARLKALLDGEKRLQREKERIAREQEQADQQAEQARSNSSQSSSSSQSNSSNSTARSAGPLTININVDGSVIGAGGERQLAEQLARLVLPEIRRLITLGA